MRAFCVRSFKGNRDATVTKENIFGRIFLSFSLRMIEISVWTIEQNPLVGQIDFSFLDWLWYGGMTMCVCVCVWLWIYEYGEYAEVVKENNDEMSIIASK